MTTIVRETPLTDHPPRAFRLDALGTNPALLTHVYVSMPCEAEDCGEHVLQIDRDVFTEMVKKELRLVEAESGSFSLTDDDLALLGWN